MREFKDATIALNVRLKPSDSSAHPRAANYTNVVVAQGNVYLDFGFIKPALLAAIAKTAKDGQVAPEGLRRPPRHPRGDGRGCTRAHAAADSASASQYAGCAAGEGEGIRLIDEAGKGGGMRQAIYQMVLTVVLIGVGGCATQTAVSETPASKNQSVASGFPVPAPANKPAWLTPEKEAALMEVRKILRETSQLAQSVAIKDPESKEGRFLDRNKKFVLRDIVTAQARAGDIEEARLTSTANGWDKSAAMGVAYAKAGRPHEGLKELVSQELDTRTRFVFEEALMKAGDPKAALEVAESRGPFLSRVPAIAYLASLQAKAGDLRNKETFQRAMELAQGFDKLKQSPQDTQPNIGKYKVLLHIARVQADAGDMTGSRNTFAKAVATALAVPETDQIIALTIVAEEQARSGDHAGSEQTFERARSATRSLAPLRQLSELKRIATTQLEVGHRAAAAETVRLILQVLSGASPGEQAEGLMRQARWHLTLGDQEAAKAALQTVVPRVRALADGYLTAKLEKGDVDYGSPESGKSNVYYSLARLAAECGLYDLAQEAVRAITIDQTKANAIRHIVTGLIQKSDRPEVQRVVQALVKDATNLIGLLSLPRDLTLLDVAVIQAAAGDVPAAVHTADRVVDALRDDAYREMVGILIRRKDWNGAQEVLSRMKVQWMLDESSHHTFRALAQAQAKVGVGKQVIEWSQTQPDAVARANVLLGVAEGLMDSAGIEPLFPVGRPYVTNY